MATFDELVAEALNAPFSGWDFSWLAARSTAGGLPWSYQGEVARRAAVAEAMLDMGTGGGERLGGQLGHPALQPGCVRGQAASCARHARDVAGPRPAAPLPADRHQAIAGHDHLVPPLGRPRIRPAVWYAHACPVNNVTAGQTSELAAPDGSGHSEQSTSLRVSFCR